MAVADLTQHNCQDFKTAQLTIKHNRQKAVLFFKDEAVQQADLGKTQGNHPLQIGPICGIYNGHINNDDELFACRLRLPPPDSSIWKDHLSASEELFPRPIEEPIFGRNPARTILMGNQKGQKCRSADAAKSSTR